MSLHVALAVAALAASIFMVVGQDARTLAVIALAASAIEVATAFGVLHFSITHLPLGLLLGVCLAAPGCLAWVRSSSKTAVTAATVVAIVGILQVLGAVGHKL